METVLKAKHKIKSTDQNEIKRILQAVMEPDRLNEHQLVETPFVQSVAQVHRLHDRTPQPGMALLFALRQLWEETLPPLPDTFPHDGKERHSLRKEWRIFLLLEMLYFADLPRQASGAPKLNSLIEGLADGERIRGALAGVESRTGRSLLNRQGYTALLNLSSEYGEEGTRLTPAALTRLRDEACARLASRVNVQLRAKRHSAANAKKSALLDDRVMHSSQHEATNAEMVDTQELAAASQLTGEIATKCLEDFVGESNPGLPAELIPIPLYSISGNPVPVDHILDWPHCLLLSQAGSGQSQLLASLAVYLTKRASAFDVPLLIHLKYPASLAAKTGDWLAAIVQYVKLVAAPHQLSQLAPALADAESNGHLIWLLDGWDELDPTDQTALQPLIRRLKRVVVVTSHSPRRIFADQIVLEIRDLDATEVCQALCSRYPVLDAWVAREPMAVEFFAWYLFVQKVVEQITLYDEQPNLLALVDKTISDQLRIHTDSVDLGQRTLDALRDLALWALDPDRGRGLRTEFKIGDGPRAAGGRETWTTEKLELARRAGFLVPATTDGTMWKFRAPVWQSYFAAEKMAQSNDWWNADILFPHWEKAVWLRSRLVVKERRWDALERFIRKAIAIQVDPLGMRWLALARCLDSISLEDQEKLASEISRIKLELRKLWFIPSPRLRREVTKALAGLFDPWQPETRLPLDVASIRDVPCELPAVPIPTRPLADLIGDQALNEESQIDTLLRILESPSVDAPRVEEAAAHLAQVNWEDFLSHTLSPSEYRANLFARFLRLAQIALREPHVGAERALAVLSARAPWGLLLPEALRGDFRSNVWAKALVYELLLAQGKRILGAENAYNVIETDGTASQTVRVST